MIKKSGVISNRKIAHTRSVKSFSFRALWAGQTISVIGDGSTLLAIPLLVLHAGGNATIAALSATPRTVGYVLIGLFAGALVDRWDIKRIMVVCDLFRFAIFVAMPFAIGLPGGLAILLVLAFVSAGLGVFFETAAAVAVRDLVTDDQLVTGNARLEMSNQLGVLLGPSLIGIIAATVGLTWCLIFNAASFLISVVTILPLRFAARRREARTGSAVSALLHDMTAGLRFISAQRVIRNLVSLQVVINLVVAAETLVVVRSRDDLHASAIWTGIAVAAAGVGGIAGTSVASWPLRYFSTELLISGGIIGLGGSLFALGAATNSIELAVANLFHGMLSVFATVHIRAVRQRIVPHQLLGRVTATARTLAFAANPIGAAAFGGIADTLGGKARWSFFIAAILSIASASVAGMGLVRRRGEIASMASRDPELP